MCPKHERRRYSPDMWGKPEENVQDCAECELDEIEDRLTAAGYTVGVIDL